MQQTLDAGRVIAPAATPGWLRSPVFDLTLILGAAALALCAGWILVHHPDSFLLLLYLDVWFLGYHHVVATFTRLAFDIESFKEHKFLILWLPILLVALLVPLFLLTGPWILGTSYLYWQWFHYMRQSYGIVRNYQRKAKPAPKINNTLNSAVVYSVAVLGILYRSYQSPGYFLSMELRCLPVPLWLLQTAAATTIVVLAAWLFLQFLALRRGQFEAATFLYLATHILVFMVGYIVIDDINRGWLVMNIWHNAQYILFVWLYNNNRFKNAVDPKHRFLSLLSQRKYIIAYFAVCILIATAVYKSVDFVLHFYTTATLPLAVIVFQSINFHHYIVDGVIWKIRRKPAS